MAEPKISIIIPTLNEEKFLPKTIECIFQHAKNTDYLEVLVVDAGSTDQTVRIAEELEAKVFSKPEFQLKKYQSLNHGISCAKGETLIFLDADTILPKEFDLKVLKALEQPQVVGGAFEFSFENSDWKLSLLQLFNRIRYRFGQMYYGDQAIYCSKSAAESIGGYPEKELMESAYFCKRLLSVGKLRLIKSPVKTSARRFNNYGFFKVFWFDFTMWIRFGLGLSVDEYGKKYWSVNMSSDG